MKAETIKKFILPPGPILSLSLIGLLLLSAVVYYRAVRIQRFLEPALAISEPRIKFSQSMNELLSRELESAKNDGIRFKAGSIFVEQTLLFDKAWNVKGSENETLKKLSRFFLSALNDRDIRNNISLILVCTRLPFSADNALNKAMRSPIQERSLLILDSLYAAEPELEKKFRPYFAATAITMISAAQESNWVEFRIVPTERLHIDVLQRLGKYMK
jgi:hypothetical protein